MRKVSTATKRLRGTLRRDRVKPRRPRPRLGVPQPPPTLTERARHEYQRLRRLLTPLCIVTAADANALELCASALAEYRVAVDVLLHEGQSYACRTKAGAVMQRARPEQAIAADAWRRAAHMLEQFGLTPASRPKVEAVLPPSTSPAVSADKRHATNSIDDWLARRTARVAGRPV